MVRVLVTVAIFHHFALSILLCMWVLKDMSNGRFYWKISLGHLNVGRIRSGICQKPTYLGLVNVNSLPYLIALEDEMT